jgi:hypothetical protein
MATERFYLRLDPDFYDDWSVAGFRVMAATKRRSRHAGVVVAIDLTVDDAAFQPLVANARIEASQAVAQLEPTEMPAEEGAGDARP